mgnify:CR=1 FL=1
MKSWDYFDYLLNKLAIVGTLVLVLAAWVKDTFV